MAASINANVVVGDWLSRTCDGGVFLCLDEVKDVHATVHCDVVHDTLVFPEFRYNVLVGHASDDIHSNLVDGTFTGLTQSPIQVQAVCGVCCNRASVATRPRGHNERTKKTRSEDDDREEKSGKKRTNSIFLRWNGSVLRRGTVSVRHFFVVRRIDHFFVDIVGIHVYPAFLRWRGVAIGVRIIWIGGLRIGTRFANALFCLLLVCRSVQL